MVNIFSHLSNVYIRDEGTSLLQRSPMCIFCETFHTCGWETLFSVCLSVCLSSIHRNGHIQPSIEDKLFHVRVTLVGKPLPQGQGSINVGFSIKKQHAYIRCWLRICEMRILGGVSFNLPNVRQTKLSE